jgi:hypothetical protein
LTIKNKNDRLFTTVILVFACVGLLYFGWQAVSDSNNKSQNNPFEYNIEKFKAEGTEYLAYDEILSFSLDILNPYAITISKTDVLYVGGENSVSVYDLSGELTDSWTINGQAYSMAIDELDQLYVSLGSQIKVLDPRGAKKSTWDSFGEDAILTSIAVGESDIYIADAGQRVVWRLEKTGTILNQIGKKDLPNDIEGFVIPSSYFDVAIGPDGFVWAVNTGRHQFENYYPNGGLRTTWSRTSLGIDGFSGCCNPSHIAVLQNGSFVTSEKGIPRVKVHNQNGELVSVVAMPKQFDEGTVGLDLAVDTLERIIVLDPKRKQIRIFQAKVNG